MRETGPSPCCTVCVDTFRCNACGACVEMAPAHFFLDPVTGKAQETSSPAPCTPELERAAAFCPRKCISVEARG